MKGTEIFWKKSLDKRHVSKKAGARTYKNKGSQMKLHLKKKKTHDVMINTGCQQDLKLFKRQACFCEEVSILG